MKKLNLRKIFLGIVAIILILTGVLVIYNYKNKKQLPAEQIAFKNCLESGGQPTSASCCLSVSHFPNTCLIGACGCSPENSHQIQICDCGSDKCFDGQYCVNK